MRTRKVGIWLAMSLASVVVAGAVAVWASPVDVVGGVETYNPNKTKFGWSSQNEQTSSENYKYVNGISDKAIKHNGPMIATYTIKLSGAPAQFRVDEAEFNPRAATFGPSGATDTFSFTAVLHGGGWRCDNPRLEWRSPTGAPVSLSFVSVVAEYKRTSPEPDFACT